MRKRTTLLAFACLAIIITAAAGYWYSQFTKEVDAMTSVTLPTFESGFSRITTEE